MKRVLPLLALIGMIFLAGCLGMQGPEPEEIEGKGVVIKSLTVEPEELEPGMEAMITLVVQNRGGAIAENVVPEILGLPQGTGEWIVSNPTPSSLTKLIPPDPERGIPEGEESYITWTLTAPSKKITMTYDFQVRVSYDYTTHSSAIIRLLSMDYYKQLSASEKEAKNWGVIKSTYTDGPLAVSFSAPSPIISWEKLEEKNETSIEVPIWVKIENVGDGSVEGNITAKPLGVHNCTGETTKNGETVVPVKLIGGKYAMIVCKLTVNKFENFNDYEPRFTFEYRYHTDKWTSVKVLKEIELGLVSPSRL